MFRNSGYCPCCDQETVFESKDDWLRDNYACMNCGSIPRERALMSVIELFFPEWTELNIHESSPSERGASDKLKRKGKRYIASQYWPNRPLGSIYDGVYNIDLEQQTFDANLFDLVVTQDVFEHLYHPDKAVREIYRTLKSGGAHICTIPMVNKTKPTEKWSVINNGNIVFLHEEEYHGNPIQEKGTPVSFHYGYDFGSLVNKWSNFNCIIFSIDDLSKGIRAEYNEVIVMRKENAFLKL